MGIMNEWCQKFAAKFCKDELCKMKLIRDFACAVNTNAVNNSNKLRPILVMLRWLAA